MKISVIDGYTENPGDLSWDGLRTPPHRRRRNCRCEQVPDKPPRSGCMPEREVYHHTGDWV